MNNKDRIEWIDCAKGFGILLVIVSHSVDSGLGSVLRGMIFSFHMPLFFVLSSITYKCSINYEQLKKKIRKATTYLLTPAMFVFGVGCLHNLYKNPELVISFSYWKMQIYKLLFASGVSMNFAGMNVEPIGIPWFFFALLIGRSLFDYFHLIFSEKKLTTICWMCSIIGILMGNTQWLPLSLDISLAIMPFFYWGYRMKSYEVGKNSIRKILVYGFIWAFTLLLQVPDLSNGRTYMELSCRRYPIYPICFVTASCGILLICEISGLLLNVAHNVGVPIVSIGKNSMYLLCVHCIDYIWSDIWYVTGSQFRTTIKRCVTDLIVFALFLLIKNAFSYVKNDKKHSDSYEKS